MISIDSRSNAETAQPLLDRAVRSRETDEPLLTTFLVDRDVPCPQCRYNLRECRTEECPECGLSLKLDVVASRPARGPWIVRLLSFALPLGFNGIMAVTATFGALWSAYWQSWDWFRLGLLWTVAIVAAVGVVRVVSGWSSFVRLPLPQQRGWAWFVAISMLFVQIIAMTLLFIVE